MDSKKFLVAGAVISFLVFASWIVSVRTKGLDMPGFKSFPTAPSQSPGPDAVPSDLPVLADRMPEFSGIADWLNSPPLKQADLRGKVVLIDFWTYSCINCIRTLPYTTSWYGKYKDKGFVLIGVHTPEFAFEKVRSNVEAALKQHGIEYPVALDSDYGTWNSYSNRYWPAEYLFDAKGRLRHTHFGEGEYDETERDIQDLLKEAGEDATMPTEAVVTPEFGKIGSPETYVGYGRSEHNGNPEPVRRDQARSYTLPANPEYNLFYFDGSWRVEEERAVLVEPGGGIAYRYQAANANLVMGAREGQTLRANVTLDGKPVPPGARGGDLNVDDSGATYVTVGEQRLYDLIDAPGTYDRRLLEVRFLEAGVSCYAFTFG